MSLKLEYEALSKEIEKTKCHPQGCDYCHMEEKCNRAKFLETYCKGKIK